MKHVHTIPVPAGATPEDAWAEICLMGCLIGVDDVMWANVECDGEECLGIEWAERGGGG
jgi:hypothetical protein